MFVCAGVIGSRRWSLDREGGAFHFISIQCVLLLYFFCCVYSAEIHRLNDMVNTWIRAND